MTNKTTKVSKATKAAMDRIEAKYAENLKRLANR